MKTVYLVIEELKCRFRYPKILFAYDTREKAANKLKALRDKKNQYMDYYIVNRKVK